MRIAALVVALMLIAPRVVACTCVGPRTTQQNIEEAALIFSGRVVSLANPQQERLNELVEPARSKAWHEGVEKSIAEGWGPHHGTRVLFENVRVFIGTASQTVELWTGQGSGDCGYEFEPGREYLVFATMSRGGRVTTHICTGTVPLVCAREELLALGEPEDVAIPVEEDLAYRNTPCLEWAYLVSDRNLEGLIRGLVEVDLVVDRNGSVSRLAFKKPQRPELERVVRSWCFQPAMLNGEPVPSRFTYISPTTPMTAEEMRKARP